MSDLSRGETHEAIVTLVQEMSHRITASYPRHLCAEAVDRRRLDKLGEEVGEVIDAYGGFVGENPRKGVTHSLDDVLSELQQTALCALGAWCHLTRWQHDPLDALLVQARIDSERLTAALDGPGIFGGESL